MHRRRHVASSASASTSSPQPSSSSIPSSSNTKMNTTSTATDMFSSDQHGSNSSYNNDNDNSNNHHHQSNNKLVLTSSSSSSSPSLTKSTILAGCYVLSGCSQPLIMTLCKGAGLADSTTQLYMLFYYLGPASVMIPLLCCPQIIFGSHNTNNYDPWPSKRTILKACCIALWDIISASINYTGAGLAGPTIFAIVYSSVTIWTALFSQVFLQRQMNNYQWLAVVIVFGGLTLTTTDSLQMGQDVMKGLLFILFGSMMHALTYVLSEGIMTVGDDKLSIPQNCACQATVAFSIFFLWQLVYTIPRWEEKIQQPMQMAETSLLYAMTILLSFSVANLIHALTFFHTLRHYPGGATSAGVMKGLQAVLVFVFTHFVYCGRMGGEEMCFTKGKLLSLITVTTGVIGYGIATQQQNQQQQKYCGGGGGKNNIIRSEYEPIHDVTTTTALSADTTFTSTVTATSAQQQQEHPHGGRVELEPLTGNKHAVHV